MFWARGSVGRAPRSQRGGREFDPLRVHHLRTLLLIQRVSTLAFFAFIDISEYIYTSIFCFITEANDFLYMEILYIKTSGENVEHIPFFAQKTKSMPV